MKYLILILSLFLITSCTTQLPEGYAPEIEEIFQEEPNAYSTLEEYYESIDYSCETNEDCEIKDIHNCCGYFPKCTNKNSYIDSQFVTDQCADQGLFGVCGFPSINSCECVNNKCEGK